MSEPLPHLDADSLSAFLEGVLPDHERQACLAHLADCAECRELAGFALDPMALPPPVAEPAWKHWFRRMPVFGAAGALAGIVVLSITLYRSEPKQVPVPASVAELRAAAEPAVVVPLPILPMKPGPKRVSQIAAAHRLDRPPAPTMANALPAAVVPTAPAALAPPPPTPAIVAGKVTDPTGGIIPGADIILRDVANDLKVKAKTDNAGQFRIADIQPGKYELQIASSGFQPANRLLELRPEQVTRVDSALALGSTSQTVEVTAASAAVLQTESAVTAFRAVPSMAAIKPPVPLIAAKGKITLKTDPSGTLLRSDNAGKKWKPIKPLWNGKIKELTAQATGPAFRLTTDIGEVWQSNDGNHWTRQ